MGHSVEYRSDIDGLRCLAVLAVVAFHCGSRTVTGGFVGVDVFFVISGFLISSQLYKEIQEGTFSLLRFYDRRMRRILPVTILIIILSLVAGYVVLPPRDYGRLGTSAAAAVTGLSNFYFYRESNYFSPGQETLPLLHTSSLAVEEQFYLVWPLLLVLLSRTLPSKRSLAIALVLLIAISLTASIVVVGGNQPEAFYMLHTRAWELAVGALLVFLPVMKSAIFSELAGGLGLAFIAYSATKLNSGSLFPGLNAVLPCVGAAMIIMPKRHLNAVSRILSLPPFLFIGRISFSLYLWHWPLIVFYRYYNFDRDPSFGVMFSLMSTAFALSVLRYFLVEPPFRKLRPR